MGDEPAWARSMPGRPAAAASSTSTASSAERRTSTTPAIYEGTIAGRAAEDAGGGLPLHRGHDGQGDRMGPPAEGADARQAVLRLLRARVRPMPRTRSRRSGRTEYKGRFDQGWDVLREETLARQKELGVVPPETELTARHRGDSRLGRDARRAQARARPTDGDLRRVPRAHRPPHRAARRRARGPRHPRGHPRLLHHRRQRRERRGDGQRDVQRDFHLQRREPISRRPSSWRRRSTSSAGRRRTTTTPSAGRTPWTRRTSGRSRSRRTGAARATARSCTGRAGSTRGARCGSSSTT